MFVINPNYQQEAANEWPCCSLVSMRTVVLLILLFGLLGESQSQELTLTKKIEGDFDFMTTDHIGRLYLAKGHELFLYSTEGELMYQFSDLSRGVITHLDATNPMKLLLFYPDYSQIAFLDNTLSRTRDNVDLTTLELELAQLACASFDNGFWVYDPVSFSLLRFDQGLNLTNEVANINQLVGADVNPSQMVEFENWLYMNDSTHGVFVFDSFGTYSKLIPIPGAEKVQPRTNGVFFQTDRKLLRYELLSLETSEIELPVDDFNSIRIEKKRLYILNDTGVLMFSITE